MFQAQFRMIGHASVLASCRGSSILFDPWFGQPINFGVMSGYPAFVAPTPEEIRSIVAIHISHIHHDHFCQKDLDIFPRNIPILIGLYKNKDFLMTLQDAGFTNIVQLRPSIQGYQVGPFRLSIFPKFPQDPTFDSSCVLNMDGMNFYLNNDCTHPDHIYNLLHHSYDSFQGAFLGYAAANPFTWSNDYSECKGLEKPMSMLENTRNRQQTAWSHVEQVAKILKPKWVVPYASSFRFMSADMAHLNQYFGSDEEIFDLDLGEDLPMVAKHGETILPQGDPKLGIKSNKTSTTVPFEHQRPKLFNCNISEQDMDQIQEDGREFFLKLFRRQVGTTWYTPLSVEVLFNGPASMRSLYFDFNGEKVNAVSSLDSGAHLVMEFPASVAADIIQDRISIANAYYMFCVKIRWRRLRFDQFHFLTWT